MFFNIHLTTSFDPVAPNTSVTWWILDGPLVGGAYLAGEQSLFHAVPLHAGWTTCTSQAALGFVQPQLQLADPLQTPMEDSLTGAGLFLRGLGHRHNTPCSTPRARVLTLPEQVECWPSWRILPPCLCLLCSSHPWLQKPLPGVGSDTVTVSLLVTLAARPQAAGAELSWHTHYFLIQLSAAAKTFLIDSVRNDPGHFAALQGRSVWHLWPCPALRSASNVLQNGDLLNYWCFNSVII